MKKDVITQAEECVSKYVTKKFGDAYSRVDKEMHGKGCGCIACKKLAVRDINQWTDFVSKGNPPVEYELENRCGKLNIRIKTETKEEE